MKRAVLIFFIALLWAFVINAAHASDVSSKDFHATWGQNNVHTSHNGHTTTLILDKKSGAEITSNGQFLLGQYDVKIKVKKGKSIEGVVTYKLTSSDSKRDEIHYEFLPEINGYTLQTNIYINGQGHREEKFNLWFDPTADFNKYSIFWNEYHVVFKVNGEPIREFRNSGSFLSAIKPMNLQASIYEKGNQATEVEVEIVNKQERSKSSKASVSFKDFKVDACALYEVSNANECKTKWWNDRKYRELTSKETAKLKEIREKYMLYSYCDDSYRNKDPRECY